MAELEDHEPMDIMIASFTKAAAAEIAGRNLPLGNRQVGTLHHFAYQSLGDRYPVAESYTDRWNELHPGLALSGGKRGIDLDDPGAAMMQGEDGQGLYMQYQALRARMLPRAGWPGPVQRFAEAWESWLREDGLIDFTGMIETALAETVAAPGSPRVGFLDEAQDCSPLEMALWRKWAARMDRVFVCLDDDQSVYPFKGADPSAVLNPPVDDDHKRVLRQSYRVPRAVHALAQSWIEQVKVREPKIYLPRDADGSVEQCPNATWQVPDVALQMVEEDLRNGKSVMFLTTCSYMLGSAGGGTGVIPLLRRRGIPFGNRYRVSRGDWNPLRGETRGQSLSTAERLLAFLRADIPTFGERAAVWSAQDVGAWSGLIKTEGVLKRGAKAAIERMKEETRPLEWAELEAWFTEEALTALLDLPLAGQLDWLEERALAAKKSALQFPCHIVRKQGGAALLRASRDGAQCTVGTIHSVKGAQSDTVVLFPDMSLAAQRERELDPDAITRVFYVGMTRARERLILCAPAQPGAVEWR
jgi:superfamily I DNA/RNA helicase